MLYLAVEVTSALCVDTSRLKDKEQECVLCCQSGSVVYVRYKVVTVVDNDVIVLDVLSCSLGRMYHSSSIW